MSEQVKSKEEQLLDYLNSTTPTQLLIDISGGVEPLESDIKLIEDVKMKTKLPDSVINVLVQYVLLKTDMRLTKGYVEKVASHWTRKKIKTAKEAMELVKKEHQQYLALQQAKNAPKKTPDMPTEELTNKFELNYIAKVVGTYHLKETVAKEIISYSRMVNQGLMVYWFMDRVAEYLSKYNPIDETAAKEVLETFHEKYVVPFGR